MKNKKNLIYALILPLVVVGGFVFANRETTDGISGTAPKVSSMADKKTDRETRKKWEASPDGVRYKKWEASPAGKKVYASHDKIRKYIKSFSNMEAVVTSVTFERPNAKSGPKWLIVKIDGEDYMMQFNLKEFKQLSALKVNDKIIVRSHSAGYSPNHPYLIVSGDYIAKNNKVLFKREFNKNNRC